MKLFQNASLCVCLFAFSQALPLRSEQVPLPLGQGSIASEPPENPNTQALFAKKPLLGPQARNRPLPTNDWWTALLTEPAFPGKLWVMPLTVDPHENGLDLYIPQTWSESGTDLVLGSPLQISGIPKQSGMVDGSILLFDFEEGQWPQDWIVKGKAFGPLPMPATQHGAAHINGNAYACSFYGGDSAVGSITSPEIPITHDYIHFRVSGGNEPDKLGVEFLVDGKVIYKTVGDQSNNLRPQRWDVQAYKGKKARIRLVDEHQGGWGFIAADTFILSDQPDAPQPGVFTRCSTINWGDSSLQFGLHAAGSARMEITLARGMPFMWIENKEVQPFITLNPADLLFSTEGTPISFPHPNPRLIISRENRLFSVYAPENCHWEKRGQALFPVSDKPSHFLVIGALPSLKLAPAFASFAYTLPRDTRYEWSFDPDKSEVLTRWSIQTEALQGNQTQVLQGWLPHHWRNTKNNLDVVPVTYQTQRGLMKVSKGNAFEFSYTFHGLPITLPLPTGEEKVETPFQPAVLDDFLTEWITNSALKKSSDRAGADTYWGGKELLALARVATLSEQRNHPLSDQALDMLREALSDWCTYTPGEPARYFARYPSPWNGVVGFNPSYGSETFSDCHFHHGYFTLSAAMLIRLDPSWGKHYQEVITPIALHYANADRTSTEFPFLRTFSPWVGHSYAGGTSSTSDGNNQESTSESMMAWAGLFLLGSALGDDHLRDTGAMGYAVEAEAIREYWNDYYAWEDPKNPAVFPEAYQAKHTIVGVRRDRDMGYFTWFSGEAKHIYGIQWFPTWTHLQYIGFDDPQFIQAQSKAMLTRQGTDSFTPLGREWGHVALGQLMWGDPQTVCKLLQQAQQNNTELGDGQNGGVTYAMAHALNILGQPATDYRSTVPTGTVYQNQFGDLTWVGWNPSTQNITVKVTQAGLERFSFQLPPGNAPIHHPLTK
ncbi:glycosyl hydrolase [Kiritimatiellota bacterium B12222]|nr:glycosyl hydrolase [Kiritimatiellota bacterium B12222]